MISIGDPPVTPKPVRRSRNHWPSYVLISVLVLAAGCCGAYRWFIYDLEGRPPELTAEYTSSEALLVAEDLAGQLIAELPVDDEGFTVFGSRGWITRTCTSGWDDNASWDGFVSVSVNYGFDVHESDLEQRLAHAQLIFDALEELGLEPTKEPQGDTDIVVSAERDDGLTVQYSSFYGLDIGTDCVVQDNEPVYTPPHVRIAPESDYQDFARWPETN
ncbi:hypothetical protein O1R50_23855 [Glycomyces luteolus]|uniref:Uncharacterized protein n=1 Tax=Glycomyces luteolus TaxID=2670330 RepID=A0A9X3PFT6_9ACTN|nr:hypothetical protein [Glycomyces luteolus]MDA1362678.1 hypothetical protein [Glycomyces luteolus]